MLSVLISGRLVRAPRVGAGRNGKTYTTALISVAVENDDPVLVSAIAFNSNAEALAALGQGDSVSIAGDGKLSHWTDREGQTKHGLGVTVHRIMTAYARRKTAKAQPEPAADDALPFDDALPPA